MRSTGEVMGIDKDFGMAFAKSQLAAYSGGLPISGRVFVSVANRDKRAMLFPIKRLADLGFEIVATAGTADVLKRAGVQATVVRKHFQPDDGTLDAVQQILAGDIALVVNTPYGVGARLDGYEIRTAAVRRGVPSLTTIQGLSAAVLGIEGMLRGEVSVRSLQEYGRDLLDHGDSKLNKTAPREA